MNTAFRIIVDNNISVRFHSAAGDAAGNSNGFVRLCVEKNEFSDVIRCGAVCALEFPDKADIGGTVNAIDPQADCLQVEIKIS